MRKVFVSGCYDIIHGGHIEFFKQAKSIGDYLIVCVASEDVLRLTKNKPTAGSNWRLQTKKKKNCIKLFHLMYDNVTTFLKRKKVKAQKIIL